MRWDIVNMIIVTDWDMYNEFWQNEWPNEYIEMTIVAQFIRQYGLVSGLWFGMIFDMIWLWTGGRDVVVVLVSSCPMRR